MPNSIRNKLILLGVVTLLAVIFFIPSLAKQMPAGWNKVFPSDGIRLGLDLQGGMHLILKVDQARAVQNQLEVTVGNLKEILRHSDNAVMSTETIGFNRMRLHFSGQAPVEAAKKMLATEFPALEVSSVSRTADESLLEVGLKDKEALAIQKNSVAQSLEIIRNRIDQFGVSEPVILQQGKDEIVVQLPGIKDPARAMELVGRTAQLEFKLVDSEGGRDLEGLIDQAVRSGRLKRNYARQDLNRHFEGKIPADDEIYLHKRKSRETGAVTYDAILLHKKAVMTGEALKTVHVEIGGEYNEPHVSLTLNARGARIFERITQANVGKQLAIILDDVVQSAPVIREAISGGRAQITGAFTTEEASDLAIVLRAGALPAPVNVVQNLTVGPSLGLDSIHKGIASTVLGTLLVVAFMAVYYRLSGVIANLALLLNLVMMLSALSLFQATLTLPGIAGIVLSIGMAVDSNVLVFERMREEFALQKPFWSSVASGYHKAWWTIIDSHVTTLITAFALFLFGTGPIKGFAVTLSIGITLNLFTALFGTKTIYDYLRFKNRLKSLRFLQIIKNPHIDFIGLRHIFFVLSGLFVALGLFAFVQIQRGRANLGVDFTGGVLVQFKAEKAFQLEDIRTALARNALSDYELQEVPQENILIVKIKKADKTVGQASGQLAEILAREFPRQRFIPENSAEVGSSVSNDLKRAALIAVAISLAGIIVYLAWRFDLRFGVAAAIATFHDVLTVLGVFYLLDREITLLVVTALLTLAGYSLTDTVVVFDRIRENMAPKSRKDMAEVINLSINEVLSRTIITSGTVLMVLAALLLMGGVLLYDFALALTIGLIVGTYSSVFVASPIVYIGPALKKHRRQTPKKSRTK